MAEDNHNRLDEFPLGYHVTFTCCGSRLHGDESGSVDPKHNIPGTPPITPSENLSRYEQSEMEEPPYEMDAPRRNVVLRTIRDVCKHRGWELLAAHVRPAHVHVVVQANVAPEKIMNDLKAYASRRLNEAGFDRRGRKRWARHGSTKYKWKIEELEAAVDYVVREQGDPMEVYEKDG